MWKLNTFVHAKELKHKMNYSLLSTAWELRFGPKGKPIIIKALTPRSEDIIKDQKRSGGKGKKDKNVRSIALAITFGYRNILIVSEIDKISWKNIQNFWEQYCELKYIKKEFDLIKVSHHGSKDGNYDILWEKLTKRNETIAVISTGCKDKSPHPDTLNAILSQRIKLYCTNLWDFSKMVDRESAIRFLDHGCITQTMLHRAILCLESLPNLSKYREEKRISPDLLRIVESLSPKGIPAISPCRPYYHGNCRITFTDSGDCTVETESNKPPLLL